MGEADDNDNGDDEFSDDDMGILKLVVKFPIMRGAIDGADMWSLVGSGEAVRKAREWLELLTAAGNFKLPHTWESDLGRELIECAMEGYHARYPCPKCGSQYLI